MKELLFVYGTLRSPRIQKEAFGRAVPGEPDTLPGYRKFPIAMKGETFPVIFPRSGSSVRGLALSLTKEELKRTDWYESRLYKRKKVTLKSGRRAWVYQKAERSFGALFNK